MPKDPVEEYVYGIIDRLVSSRHALRLAARHMHELGRRFDEGHTTPDFDRCQHPTCKAAVAAINETMPAPDAHLEASYDDRSDGGEA